MAECRKHKHQSYAAALAHCRSMADKPDAGGLMPYHCGQCGRYHIGNSKRSKRGKAKAMAALAKTEEER